MKQATPHSWQVQVRTRSGSGALGPLHAMSMQIPANDAPEPAAAVSDSGSGVVAWVTAQSVMAGIGAAGGATRPPPSPDPGHRPAGHPPPTGRRSPSGASPAGRRGHGRYVGID